GAAGQQRCSEIFSDIVKRGLEARKRRCEETHCGFVAKPDDREILPWLATEFREAPVDADGGGLVDEDDRRGWLGHPQHLVDQVVSRLLLAPGDEDQIWVERHLVPLKGLPVAAL